MPNEEDGASVYRQTLSKQIIKTATADFLSKGIKAVKMDDIANELSISKRTLYEVFANKEDLLLECVKNLYAEYQKHMDNFINEDTSVIAIIMETYRYQMEQINNISPAYYYELPKYRIVTKWRDEEHERNEWKAMKFYKQGVKEGYFRDDVDFELIGKVCGTSVKFIMESEFLKHYSIKHIFQNVILLYVRGFCTLKGVKALDEYNLK